MMVSVEAGVTEFSVPFVVELVEVVAPGSGTEAPEGFTGINSVIRDITINQL